MAPLPLSTGQVPSRWGQERWAARPKSGVRTRLASCLLEAISAAPETLPACIPVAFATRLNPSAHVAIQNTQEIHGSGCATPASIASRGARSRRRIHNVHWFHPRPALVTPPARSLAPIRMPSPERRHLLGRLLNEMPGRTSRIRTLLQHDDTAPFSLRFAIVVRVLCSRCNTSPSGVDTYNAAELSSPQAGRLTSTASRIRSMTLAATKEKAADRLARRHTCPSLSVMAAQLQPRGRSLKDTALSQNARAFFNQMSPRPSGLRQ
jgi:hypothetical protein